MPPQIPIPSTVRPQAPHAAPIAAGSVAFQLPAPGLCLCLQPVHEFAEPFRLQQLG